MMQIAADCCKILIMAVRPFLVGTDGGGGREGVGQNLYLAWNYCWFWFRFSNSPFYCWRAIVLNLGNIVGFMSATLLATLASPVDCFYQSQISSLMMSLLTQACSPSLSLSPTHSDISSQVSPLSLSPHWRSSSYWQVTQSQWFISDLISPEWSTPDQRS